MKRMVGLVFSMLLVFALAACGSGEKDVPAEESLPEESGGVVTLSAESADQKIALELSLSEEIGGMCTLNVEEAAPYAEVNFFLLMEVEEQLANIATFTVYNEEQYMQLQEEEGPKPDELQRVSGFVLTHSGLQSQPFPEGSKAAEMADLYQSHLAEVLESVDFTIQ